MNKNSVPAHTLVAYRILKDDSSVMREFCCPYSAVPRRLSLAANHTFPLFTRRTRAQPPPSKALLHVKAGKKDRTIWAKEASQLYDRILTAYLIVSHVNIGASVLQQVSRSQKGCISAGCFAITMENTSLARLSQKLFITVKGKPRRTSLQLGSRSCRTAASQLIIQ
jgi:hypothetical protein